MPNPLYSMFGAYREWLLNIVCSSQLLLSISRTILQYMKLNIFTPKNHKLGGFRLSHKNLLIYTGECQRTGPLKKLFHYAIFQKFFHIFIIHSWSMFYNTYYEMFMPLCFHKLYQRIIRQHLYISIKYIPMKNTTTYFKYILMKTQQHCTVSPMFTVVALGPVAC